MNMGWKRGLGAGVVAVVAVTAAAIVVVGRPPAATAEQVKARCVRALRSERAWRARYVETTNGSDGAQSVVRTEIVVRQPDDYHIVVRERRGQGSVAVSETMRLGNTLYTRRVGDNGTAEMLVMKGVPPAVGVSLDNSLGETVQAVADATELKVLGRERVNGRGTWKLELSEGRHVWVDEVTGLPIREREVSGNITSREVTFELFDADPTVTASEFSVAALGSVESTVVEDLGFRAVPKPADAARVIGFEPLAAPVVAGYRVAQQGYRDPGVKQGEGVAEAAFVTKLVNGSKAVLITQTLRPDLGTEIRPVPADEPDPPREIKLSGKRALIRNSANGCQMMFMRGKVLVFFEGNVTGDELIAVGRALR